MKKIIFFLLLISSMQLHAQNCVDSSASSGNCLSCRGLDYSPVCGCNNKNYRNDCEAMNCANLLSDSSTICDYVEFEFLPTLLSGTGNYGTAPSGKICIYVKYAGAATIQIYNAFGKKMYEQVLIAYYDKAFLPGNSFKGTTPDYLDITETASFQRGVYIVVVSVEGQSKSKKFLKT